MIPQRQPKGQEENTCPHTRGDDPTPYIAAAMSLRLVPTRVGMILELFNAKSASIACPHTRGDDPFVGDLDTSAKLLSPHAWG